MGAATNIVGLVPDNCFALLDDVGKIGAQSGRTTAGHADPQTHIRITDVSECPSRRAIPWHAKSCMRWQAITRSQSSGLDKQQKFFHACRCSINCSLAAIIITLGSFLVTASAPDQPARVLKAVPGNHMQGRMAADERRTNISCVQQRLGQILEQLHACTPLTCGISTCVKTCLPSAADGRSEGGLESSYAGWLRFSASISHRGRQHLHTAGYWASCWM